jgi:hypothetical protein
MTDVLLSTAMRQKEEYLRGQFYVGVCFRAGVYVGVRRID